MKDQEEIPVEEIYLPILSHFTNGNSWLAGQGLLRFRITADSQGKTLCCQVWEGPLCYELSQVEEEKTVPLSEEGLASLRPFLALWQARMAARPAPALSQTLERWERARGKGGEGGAGA